MGTRVQQVAVKKRGGFTLMSRKQFMDMPSAEKKSLLAARNAEFIDKDSQPIPFMEGLKDLLDK